jgi:hypothetical protein
MAYRYDARGNIYIVSSPQELQTDGVSIPDDARQAALTKGSWAGPAITHFCGWGHEGRPAGAKAHRSDGLLVGPFRIGQDADLLVVNTDGSLAKRSGNGLTIFAQALKDKNVGDPDAPRVLRVHHDQPGPTPTVTNVEPATVDGASGFWLDLGVPFFGPEEVGARSSTIGPAPPTSHGFYRVHRLADVDAAWERSVFVNVGNPQGYCSADNGATGSGRVV